MSWWIGPDASYRATPATGTLSPGEVAEVTIERVHTSPAWPTELNLWVTDPANPDIPRAQWLGGIAFGP
jgi:hypothetical protein